MQRIFFPGANAQLSAVLLGDKTKPPVIVVHGLRDHALGMFELLEPLSKDYFVIAMDLRGHGHSDKLQTYTMIQYMADLKRLFAHMELEQTRLIGHSLGGHIAIRFTATYPSMVSQLVLLDGMGPPGAPGGNEPAEIQARLRFHIDTVEAISGVRKAMVDQEDAKLRLRRNNPSISDSLLELVVREGVEDHPEGGVRWRWESAANMIWSTFSHSETEELICLIDCPTLIVTGERGLDYWTEMRPELDDQAFYESELRRREKLFNNGRHVVIPDAGHMLHYDQPKAVYSEIDRFF